VNGKARVGREGERTNVGGLLKRRRSTFKRVEEHKSVEFLRSSCQKDVGMKGKGREIGGEGEKKRGRGNVRKGNRWGLTKGVHEYHRVTGKEGPKVRNLKSRAIWQSSDREKEVDASGKPRQRVGVGGVRGTG